MMVLLAIFSPSAQTAKSLSNQSLFMSFRSFSGVSMLLRSSSNTLVNFKLWLKVVIGDVQCDVGLLFP